jgi:hypothetical protein
MKSLMNAVVVAAVFAVPAVSFAQQQHPLTRAEVRAQLAELHAVGYTPATWMRYPDTIQAANAKIAEKNDAAATAYGSASNGSSQSGE